MSHFKSSSQADSEDLIGKLLNLCDNSDSPPEPDHSPRLDKIRQGLFLLADDDMEIAMPPRLAEKTLARIHKKTTLQEHLRETVIPRRSWRISDIAVAASIVFAMFLGTFPALNRARFTASNLACSANLSQLWQSAEQYSTAFDFYPSALAQNQQMPAGALLVLMKHTGHLNDSVTLSCPGCGSQVHAGELPEWTEVEKNLARNNPQLESAMQNVYAVHPGMSGPNGLTHLRRNMPDQLRSNVPLFGDRPAPTNFWSQVHINSDSHGGLGQNVVFVDGHVEFSKSRRFHKSNDDIYTNHLGEVSAPSSADDMILVPAWFRLGR